jgi:hypothetical protein
LKVTTKFAVAETPVALSAGESVETVGAVVSTLKVETLKGVEAFKAASVTVIVQLLYVASVSVVNVIVLLPTVAEVVAEEHEPP